MHLWERQNWKNIYAGKDVRRGLRVRYAPGVDPEVKASIGRFVDWIRWQYEFPMRVVLYVKAEKSIHAMDGTYVNGTFFRPYDPFTEPYIRVATGYFQDDMKKRGRDNALATILNTVAHELTHYYQWVNGLEQTLRGEEYQATLYAHRMVDEYACYVDHP